MKSASVSARRIFTRGICDAESSQLRSVNERVDSRRVLASFLAHDGGCFTGERAERDGAFATSNLGRQRGFAGAGVSSKVKEWFDPGLEPGIDRGHGLDLLRRPHDLARRYAFWSDG